MNSPHIVERVNETASHWVCRAPHLTGTLNEVGRCRPHTLGVSGRAVAPCVEESVTYENGASALRALKVLLPWQPERGVYPEILLPVYPALLEDGCLELSLIHI